MSEFCRNRVEPFDTQRELVERMVRDFVKIGFQESIARQHIREMLAKAPTPRYFHTVRVQLEVVIETDSDAPREHDIHRLVKEQTLNSLGKYTSRDNHRIVKTEIEY